MTPADVWSWNRDNLGDAYRAALDPQTWRDAAGAYGQALLAGSVAPGGGGAGVRGWFGKSKIVDEAGLPRVVYHGTRAAAPFEAFDQAAAEKTGRWNNDADSGMGFHFTPDPETAAGYGKVGQYHLKIEKPLHINEEDVSRAQDAWLNDLAWSGNPEDERLADYIQSVKAFDRPGSGYYNYGLYLLGQEAKANGHDGIIFSRMRDFTDQRPIDEYIVFSPENIRPAGGQPQQ
jgi:hypothetical protein